MKTLQHAALFFMAFCAKYDSREMDIFKEKVPWVLLPDGIRAYVEPRQIFHYEITPDGEDVSWGKFPEPEDLVLMNKENTRRMVKTHFVPEKYPKCVIGEETQLEVFDAQNFGHTQFHLLRIHFLQDMVLDYVLREVFVDVSQRFADKFTLKTAANSVINGEELRAEISEFEMIGFLHLVGKIYNLTGILLNQKWFDENVMCALKESAYPADLAESTYGYMRIPTDIEYRINMLDFDISAEKCFGITGTELENVLDFMYSQAYIETVSECF